MSATAAEISVGTTIARRGYSIEGMLLAAGAAAAASFSVYMGVIGEVVSAGVTLNAAGTGYEVDDELTIASPASGGLPIRIRVLTVDTGGEILTFETVAYDEGTGIVGDGFVTASAAAVTGGTGNDDATFDIVASSPNAQLVAHVVAPQATSFHMNQCISSLIKEATSFVVAGTGAKAFAYYK